MHYAFEHLKLRPDASGYSTLLAAFRYASFTVAQCG